MTSAQLNRKARRLYVPRKFVLRFAEFCVALDADWDSGQMEFQTVEFDNRLALNTYIIEQGLQSYTYEEVM